MHYFSSSNPTQDTHKMAVTIRGCEYQVQAAAGVFSHQRLDLGTRVLLETVPEVGQAQNALDLGCGWGPITLALARECTGTVWALDVNERALDLTRKNVRTAGFSNVNVVTETEIDPDIQFDLIWSNPPIRIGKAALHELLQKWLGRLSPTGVAYLVVAKNLGADSHAKWLETQGFHATKLASKKGYRILQVERA